LTRSIAAHIIELTLRGMMMSSEDKQAAASYLADMAKELRAIADRHGLKALSYIFGLAEADAKIASGERPVLPKGWNGPEKPAPVACDTPEEHR
jgi:hypothetical protein